MNRAERRREQKARSKVHIMTHDDLMYDKGLRAGIHEGIKMESGQSVRMMTTAAVAVLHHEFGFGQQRIIRFLSHVSWMLETIQEDRTREKRYREWLGEKTGVDLDDFTGGRDIELRERLQHEYDLGILAGVKEEDDNNEPR